MASSDEIEELVAGQTVDEPNIMYPCMDQHEAKRTQLDLNSWDLIWMID